jgi:hypothetical protein
MDISSESSSDYLNHNWNLGIHKTERNNGFFRKPSIKIGKLKPLDHKITIDNHKQEIFQAIRWYLPISHEKWKIFSINTSGCRIEINIMKNNTTICDQDIPLYWRRGRKLPEKCSIDTMYGTNTPDRNLQVDYRLHICTP